MFRSIVIRATTTAVCVALTLLAMGGPVAANGAPQLVTDVNVLPQSSDPDPIVDVGGTAYVFGCNGGGEFGLWTSQGTAGTTAMVADLGPCADAWVGSTATLGGRLFFSTIPALWSSDGTPEGTGVVGEGLAWSEGLTVVGSTLFFIAYTEAAGWGPELWKSDGTPDGTVKVSDVYGTQLTSAGGSLFFEVSGSLWKSDGTPDGTVKVKDPVPGGSWLKELTAVGARLYFVAGSNGKSGADLWTSNGTAGGTRRVKDIDPTRADAVSNLTGVGSSLFFQARDSSHGPELWKSNGTASGTSMVKDIRAGAAGSKPADLVNVGGTLFFTANDGVHGRQLWKSDGTKLGTKRVSSTVPTPPGEGGRSTKVAIGSTLYFSAVGPGGDELWMSDGTNSGTRQVADINPSGDGAPRGLVDVGGTLFFSADDGVAGRELWVSDGTGAGTSLVSDLDAATVGADPQGLVRVGSTVFFAADDGVHGQELWKTDGTANGTQLVKDINAGAPSAFWNADSETPIIEMAAVGSEVYFAADDGIHGWALWKSDGTAPGTTLVRDVARNGPASNPGELTPFGGKLLFVAECTHGSCLWITDGTSTGTIRLTKNGSAAVGLAVSDLVRVGSTVFFGGWTSPGTEEHLHLWKTDGTKAGTVQVSPVEWLSPKGGVAMDGLLYFGGPDVNDLWVSDGTAIGTHRVRKIESDTGIGDLTKVGGRLFFTTSRWDSTYEVDVPQLWTSDGTKAGTKFLYEFRVGSTIGELTAIGSTLAFSADVDGNGNDLWVSDGTVGGTYCLWAYGGLDPAALRTISGSLYLAAGEADGAEPWLVDGTTLNGHLLADINPGSPGSHPAHFTKLGSTILFTADDGSHGRELWTMPSP